MVSPSGTFCRPASVTNPLRREARQNPLEARELRAPLHDKHDGRRWQRFSDRGSPSDSSKDSRMKPATCKLQQPLPIARARQFTAQYPHQRTPLGLR